METNFDAQLNTIQSALGEVMGHLLQVQSDLTKKQNFVQTLQAALDQVKQ